MSRVSRFFDRTPAYDADTGEFLFRCQVNNYDGSHRDAHAAYRRILSVVPSTKIPESGVVQVFDEAWIVAAPIMDGWETAHRQRHVMQMTVGKVQIFTLDALLKGDPPLEVWGDVQWVVGTKEKDFSSDSPQVYDVYFPHDHNLAPHRVLKSKGRLYLGQFQYDSAAGFTVYRTFRQEHGDLVDVEVIVRKHNPATGRAEEVATSAVKAMVVRWQEFFEYTVEEATKHVTGDKVFLVPVGTQVDAKSRVRALGRLWSVHALQERSGALALHVRPA